VTRRNFPHAARAGQELPGAGNFCRVGRQILPLFVKWLLTKNAENRAKQWFTAAHANVNKCECAALEKEKEAVLSHRLASVGDSRSDQK
jgi:hypothetical protein